MFRSPDISHRNRCLHFRLFPAASEPSALEPLLASATHGPCLSSSRSEKPSMDAILFRITSFAYPRHLTPIESYSCEKQGGGVPSSSLPRDFYTSFITHSNVRNPIIVMHLLHGSLDTRGWARSPLLTRHSPLPPDIEILILADARGQTIQPTPRPDTPCQPPPACLNSSRARWHPSRAPRAMPDKE